MATERLPTAVLLLLFQLLCLCCLHVCTNECGPVRFGDRCQLQCHCEGNCTARGRCSSGGCRPAFLGPTCQQQNVALRKFTNSSSHFETSTSDKAVDGDTRQDDVNFCFHSALRQNSSWWFVDLDAVFPMDNIVIYYRQSTFIRFTGTTIYVSNTTGPDVNCTTISNTSLYQNATVRLDCDHSAQRLIFRQTDHCRGCTDGTCTGCFLEPCEVQVLVCTKGTYGQNCTGQCGHCSDSASCHHETGSCLSGSCQPGYRGDRCDEECLNGTYGQDCTTSCGHCLDGAICHHVNGSCLNGSCQPGYMGDRCDQECSSGTYGQDCAKNCSLCPDGAACHHKTGSCPSRDCPPGYSGDRCDQGGSSSGAVAGGAVAAALVVLALVLLLLLVLWRRRRARGEDDCLKWRKLLRSGRNPRANSDVYANVAFEGGSRRTGINGGNKADHSPSAASPYSNMVAHPNTADVSSPSCVTTSKLEKVVATKKTSGLFEEEFESVSDEFLAKYDVSQMEKQVKKNKFKAYCPYDFNRVVLEPAPRDPDSHYINASFIDGFKKEKLYIAAQAPIPVTLPDFLRMIWQKKCSHVVMLTNLMEDLRVKCVRYWPEGEEKELKSGDVTVTVTRKTEWSYCTLRQLTLTHESGGSLSVKQFHFTTWPDHGVPSHVDMLDFFWKVRASWTPDSGPLLVHCSAGVGRTGTFIALCILSDQAASQQRVDPLATLTALRHQRRNMIQTLAQYEFLHEALVRVVLLGRTAMDKGDFCSRFPSERGGLLVGNRTLDQLAQDIPKLCAETKNDADSEGPVYSNDDMDYFERSLQMASTAARRGFELVKLWGSGTEAQAPPGLWNFLLGTQACVLLDLHSGQSLVREGRREQQDNCVEWGQPRSPQPGLTSCPLTLHSKSSPPAEVEYIAFDVSKAQMPGCMVNVASRLASIQQKASSPIVLLYRPGEGRRAQLLCAAVSLAESLGLDGQVELVSSLLRLRTPPHPEVVKKLAEVAYACLQEDTSVYSN